MLALTFIYQCTHRYSDGSPSTTRRPGIYGYPGDKKNANGKLRLLYECAPMSMIAEQAGGLGSTGTERVMDIVPTKVHQRVPLFVGSPAEVRYLESFTKKAQA